MNTAHSPSVGQVARAALAAGISVVPPKEDGTKRPDGQWKRYQVDRASADQLELWYQSRQPKTGLGFVTGSVSGGLELFELDADFYSEFRATADAVGLGPLLDRIEAGYLERSPGGGWHLLYYCDQVEGNTKLAQEPGPPDPKTGKPTVNVLIETRGEGGYVVVAPSNGTVHPSGGRYELLKGGVETIATITSVERDQLFALARTFDRMPVEEGKSPLGGKQTVRATKAAGEGEGTRPGDDYNARTTWDDLLASRGWTKLYTRGETTYWRRPGKSEGWSATTNHQGSGLLWVFTTSSAFEQGRSYDPFGAYATVEHGGVFEVAAKSLSEQGYGVFPAWIWDEEAGDWVEGIEPNPCPKGRGTTVRLRKEGEPKPRPLRIPGGVESNGKAEGPPDSVSPTTHVIDPGRFNLTDLGNAERLVFRHGADLRYCHPWKRWLVWDGRRWALDNTAASRRKARKTVRAIYGEARDEEAEDRRKALVKWGLESEKRDRLSAMLSVAEAEEGVPILPEMMDKDPWLFNCRNGTVNLKTGELRPHRREDLITKLCPLNYRPNAPCGLWESTISLFLAANPGLIDYFQLIAGYAITGIVRDQIMPVAYGKGSNGKSTILGALIDVFGPDYAMKCPPDMLMAKKTDSHPTDRADLFGKRLVVAIETEGGRRLNETMVKELTGRDRIRARRMREDFWEFDPTHKLWMGTNHKPIIRGTDHGIWRRLKLIPFAVRVEGDRDDKEMPDKLRAEYEGVLAWCVRGCLRWQSEGLKEPAEVTEASDDYRREQDVFGAFLEEHCIFSPNVRAKTGDLFAKYKAWCESSNEFAMSSTAFGIAMSDRGIDKKKSGDLWYIGIGLKTDDDGPAF
jgi:putative DNA primase/helicase